MSQGAFHSLNAIASHPTGCTLLGHVCDPLAAHRPTCMRYLALCCDYDGTIAHHGVVDPHTIASLERVAASGRKLILVTGRVLPELQEVFPPLELF
ncbi:MAG TPA: HAD hydrolase family protein, partial [Gemmatimonadales bacterium]|nr:HAD hydrolase family protein [Gemmatimonadales bacterium]